MTFWESSWFSFFAWVVVGWLAAFGVVKLVLRSLSDDAIDRLPFEVDLRLFFVRVDSPVFNRTVYRVARSNRAWLLQWFRWGALWGALLLTLGPFLMIYALAQTLRVWLSDTASDEAAMVLTPIIPGLNVPPHELVMYALAVALGAAVHEGGHALAAAALECRINSVGFFLALVAPGVFVDMSVDDLFALPPMEQLKVFCAGAWHNTVLAALALALVLAQPLLQAPFFVAAGNGVTAIPLRGDLFRAHDRIVALDGCAVTNRESWSACLGERVLNGSSGAEPPRFGYCVNSSELQHVAAASTGTDCCEPQSASPFQCFQLDGSFCLRSADVLLFRRHRRCASSAECAQCLVPRFDEPWEQLFAIDVVSADGAPRTQLFRGAAESLWQSVDVSDVQPRWAALTRLLDALGVNVDAVPALIERQCMYIVSLNAGMALLSVAPAFKWDGEYALPPLLRLLLGTPPRDSERERDRTRLATLLLRAGSALIATTVLASLAQFFQSLQG